MTALDVDRVDGREKTGGTARYTADTQVEDVTYAVFATGTIARGRIVELDAAAAEAAPGVVAVFTHLNLPQAREFGPPVGQTQLPLHGDEIRYEGQPIAIAVAETLEEATHAARLVRATYEPEPFEVHEHAPTPACKRVALRARVLAGVVRQSSILAPCPATCGPPPPSIPS